MLKTLSFVSFLCGLMLTAHTATAQRSNVTTNTDGTKYKACGDVPSGSVASGVLVFTSCS
jgi:hypothetical protein